MSDTQNWNELSQEQQLEVAEYAIETLGKELLSVPNVHSVGFGFKERAFELTKKPCIKLSVSFKRKTNTKKHGQIPTFYSVEYSFENKLKTYAVPTDVILIKQLNLQAGIGGSATRTVSSLYPGRYEGGTACCYVKFPNYDKYYLLGCAHTLAMIKRFPPPQPGQELSIETLAYPYYQQNRFGVLKWLARLDKADAALVEIENFQSRTTGYEPMGYNFTGIWQERYPQNYSIHTKRGVIRCEWSTQYKRHSPSVGLHGKDYYFPNVVCSKTINGSSKGGDSGSPVVSDNGYLLGMHFAGHKDYAFSIPILDVFQAFEPPVELVIR